MSSLFGNGDEFYEALGNLGKLARKNATRKIAELPQEETCRDKQHNPPQHMVYEDGVWQHTCPGCGKIQTFTVRKPTY